jgi:hypothetical protein
MRTHDTPTSAMYPGARARDLLLRSLLLTPRLRTLPASPDRQNRAEIFRFNALGVGAGILSRLTVDDAIHALAMLPPSARPLVFSGELGRDDMLSAAWLSNGHLCGARLTLSEAYLLADGSPVQTRFLRARFGGVL